MSLIDDIRKDREAGTEGPWRLEDNGIELKLIMGDSCEMCDMQYYPWTPEDKVDWKRMARVPDMEAALLAADELAEAIKKDAWENTETWAALVAYRKATESSNDT